mmetsp:Transcript_1796/g.5497  ORF Transcript_1796/g.5497 Transcript_1796/m.5497 type:complete len:282 (-) Transcript_1796:114-959(-)
MLHDRLQRPRAASVAPVPTFVVLPHGLGAGCRPCWRHRLVWGADLHGPQPDARAPLPRLRRAGREERGEDLEARGVVAAVLAHDAARRLAALARELGRAAAHRLHAGGGLWAFRLAAHLRRLWRLRGPGKLRHDARPPWRRLVRRSLRPHRGLGQLHPDHLESDVARRHQVAERADLLRGHVSVPHRRHQLLAVDGFRGARGRAARGRRAGHDDLCGQAAAPPVAPRHARVRRGPATRPGGRHPGLVPGQDGGGRELALPLHASEMLTAPSAFYGLLERNG